MSKHTPGPWEYRWNGHYFDVGILTRESIVPIFPAVCIGVQAGLEANARLIAAAPELLEALKDIVEWTELGDYEESFLAKARAAISKAEGAQ